MLTETTTPAAPTTTTAPTIEQCIADPALATAVRDLAAKLERQTWLNNSQVNNETYVRELEEALTVAEERRGPSRLLGRGVDATYRANDAAVRWLRERLSVVSSALFEQCGFLSDPDENG